MFKIEKREDKIYCKNLKTVIALNEEDEEIEVRIFDGDEERIDSELLREQNAQLESENTHFTNKIEENNAIITENNQKLEEVEVIEAIIAEEKEEELIER